MNDELVTLLDAKTFEALFPQAHVMRVTVRDEKRVTRFPVEDGTERSDHVIILPKEIQLDYSLTDDAKIVHQAIQQAFRENRLVSVQTKMGTYPNMLIESMPHDEVSSNSAIPVNVTLVEWISVKPEYTDAPMKRADVKETKQASSVNRGQQTTTPADPAKTQKGSVLHGLLN